MNLCTCIFVCLLIPACMVPATETEPAWQPLFNGKNLKEWQIEGEASWDTVALTARLVVGGDGKVQRLIYPEAYDFFVLKFMFWTEGGRTNVGLCSREDQEPLYEISTSPVAELGVIHKKGSNQYTPVDSADIARWFYPGEWNEMTIRVTQSAIIVEIDDYETSSMPRAEPLCAGSLYFQLEGSPGAWLHIRDVAIVAL